jgi:ABC-type amino acid transport substrate-binding protein/cbb3-type cytochrome oxidase subunit 3
MNYYYPNGFSGIHLLILKDALTRAGFMPESYSIQCIDPSTFPLLLQQQTIDAFIGIVSPNVTLIQAGLQFSVPLWHSGWYLLTTATKSFGGFDFITLLDWKLWLLILASLLVVAHLVWYLEKEENLSMPNEYIKGIGLTIWTIMAGLFVGIETHVLTFPGRMVYGSYLFTMLILWVFYFPQILIRFTDSPVQAKYTDISDLLYPRLGMNTYNSAASELLASYNATFDHTGTHFFDSNDDLVSSLITGNLDFVLMERELVLYYAYSDSACVLIPLGVQKGFVNHHVVFRSGYDSTVISKINSGILKSLASGIEEKAIRITFPISSKNCSTFSAPGQIGIADISGTFIIYLIMIFLALVWILTSRYNTKKKYKRLMQHMIAEDDNDDEKYTKDLDLMLRFELILNANEKKFKRKLKDLSQALTFHGENIKTFIGNMQTLSEEVKSVGLSNNR